MKTIQLALFLILVSSNAFSESKETTQGEETTSTITVRELR